MSVYKDNKTGKWFTTFRYTDWTGKRKQVKKAGFALRREALEYEHNFLEKQSKSPDILFKNLYANYIEDCSHRLKYSTLVRKQSIFSKNILPYFENKPINTISAADVRLWQNNLIKTNLAETSLKIINGELSAIFNFALKYYELIINPAKQCGSIGKQKADTMEFWAKEEFDTFISVVDDVRYNTIFYLLFYTGMRIGELLALTGNDFCYSPPTVSINKTYSKIGKKEIITTPKTEKSKRVIHLPMFLIDKIKVYIGCIYAYDPGNKLFDVSKSDLYSNLKKYSASANVKKIRIHDFRHSHASLLINMGIQPMEIRDRLGHENITTTLQTYGHLYPNKQEEIAAKLQELY